MCKYLAGIAKNYGMKAVAIGGMPDHVHILLSLASEVSISKAVNVLKSKFIKMDESNRASCLAGGIRSLQREHIGIE